MRQPTRPLLAAALCAVVVIAMGCSSSTKKTAETTTSSTTAVTTGSSSTLAGSSTTAAAAGGLSGTWSGNYSGSYSGTFTLSWQQSGSNLSGTIMISSFNNTPTNINGTVHGDSIQFGTVGSRAITYSGSAAGNSMSGSWQIQAGGNSAGGGSWSASKSS